MKNNRATTETVQQGLDTIGLESALAKSTATLVSVRVRDLKGRIKSEDKRYESAEWNEFLRSIRTLGVQQPVIVRKSPQDGEYELVEGRHRVLALEQLKVHEVPAIVRDDLNVGATDVLAFTLNAQRKAATPLEEAKHFKAAIDAGLKRHEIANAAGCSESTVAARLRLLDLPEAVAELVGTHVRQDEADALASLKGAPEAWGRVAAKAVVAAVTNKRYERKDYLAAEAIEAKGLALRAATFHADVGVENVKALEKAARIHKAVDVGGQLLIPKEEQEAFLGKVERLRAKRNEAEAAERAAKADVSLEEKAHRLQPALMRRMLFDAGEKAMAGLIAMPAEAEYRAWRASLHQPYFKKDAHEWLVRLGLTEPILDAIAGKGVDDGVLRALFDSPARWRATAAIQYHNECLLGSSDRDAALTDWTGRGSDAWYEESVAAARRKATGEDKAAAKADKEARRAWQREHPHYCPRDPVEHRFKTREELEAHDCPGAEDARSVTAEQDAGRLKDAAARRKAAKRANAPFAMHDA